MYLRNSANENTHFIPVMFVYNNFPFHDLEEKYDKISFIQKLSNLHSIRHLPVLVVLVDVGSFKKAPTAEACSRFI